MKTNGLRNKKPQCARAARRCIGRHLAALNDKGRWANKFRRKGWDCIVRWHRATWRKS